MWLWLDSIYDIVRYMIMVLLWDGEVCDYVPSTRWWGMWLHSICEMVRYVIMFHLWDGEVCDYVPSMRWWGLCWEMDDLHGTLGYNGQIGLRNLGGISEWWLPNIWCTHLTLETHRPHFATPNGLWDYTFWSWELMDWYMLYPYVTITSNCHPCGWVRPSTPRRLGGIVGPCYVSSVTISCVQCDYQWCQV